MEGILGTLYRPYTEKEKAEDSDKQRAKARHKGSMKWHIQQEVKKSGVVLSLKIRVAGSWKMGFHQQSNIISSQSKRNRTVSFQWIKKTEKQHSWNETELDTLKSNRIPAISKS